MTTPYDPAPPTDRELLADGDYRRCHVCEQWYCPTGASAGVAVYICRNCREDAK